MRSEVERAHEGGAEGIEAGDERALAHRMGGERIVERATPGGEPVSDASRRRPARHAVAGPETSIPSRAGAPTLSHPPEAA
ncbi:MAG: hypothetical protein ACOC9N_01975 [Gemmatimonadota bacterium]